MSFTVGGSTPQLTFADATVQNTAALPLTGGSVSADITVHGLTVGQGGGSVSTNTAVGASALAANTTGAFNNALGNFALSANTSGGYNSAFGHNALGQQTTASYNSAFGWAALYNNTTGANNTANGYGALQNNTTASYNTAVGYQAGYSNTTGFASVYLGGQSGYTNSTGKYQTFIGYTAGYSTTSDNSTFVGFQAGYSTTGAGNCFIGAYATSTGYGSGQQVTTGTKNTILGSYNGNQGGLDIRTTSNYIVLSDGDGNPRLWHSGSFLACPTVYSVTTASTPNVFVDSSGGIYRGGVSALKYKQDVRDLEEIDISLIRAVRYKSKCEIDDQTKDHFGVIADEVAKAGITELVNYGADGEVEGFQYERLTVVLLKKLQVLESEFKTYKEAHP